MQNARLFLQERLAIMLMVGILSTISIITFSERSKHAKEKSGTFLVRVIGEVVEEKIVSLFPGATIADALASITFTESADPQKLAYDVRLIKDQIVVVPKKGALSIFVTGAVAKEELLSFDDGKKATFLDLRKKIQLHPNADIKAFFRKKRKLKEGETITIAFKK